MYSHSLMSVSPLQLCVPTRLKDRSALKDEMRERDDDETDLDGVDVDLLEHELVLAHARLPGDEVAPVPLELPCSQTDEREDEERDGCEERDRPAR